MVSPATCILAFQSGEGPREFALAPGGSVGIIAVYGVLLAAGLFLDVALLIQWRKRPPDGRSALGRMKNRPWTGVDIAWLIGVIVLLHGIMIGLMQSVHLLGALEPADETALRLIAHSVALHWAALIVVLFRMAGRQISWAEAFLHTGHRWGTSVRTGLLAYAACLPAVVFYSVLYQLWLRWKGISVEAQDVVQLFYSLDSGAIAVYAVFLAVILAPLAEEVIFRGVLLPVMVRKWGLGPAIMLNALFFALVHAHVPSMAPLFVFSAALSLAYLWTGSLWVPVTMHMAFNAVTLALMRWAFTGGVGG